MAIKEIKREWSPCQLDYVKTFLLHSEKELKDLPKCCIGSKAIVSETDNEYFCTESGWKLGSELGGGSSEVVILPETELVPVEVTPGESGIYNIINVPFENKPVAGSTGKLVWGGVEYTSKAVDVSALMDMPEGSMLCMGNLAVLGETPPGIENPIPDAPFLLMMYPDGMPANTDIGYGQMMSVGITPEPPVLSIVQVGAASGGGTEPGYLYINGVAESIASTNPVNVTMDTPFETVLAAMQSGRPVFCSLSGYNSAMVYVLQGMGYAAEIGMIVLACNYQTKVEVTWSSAGTCTARLL